MNAEFYHTPVLFNEVINLLNLKAGQIVVDGTLGGGGHAGEIVKRIAPAGCFIGIDKDKEALVNARKKLAGDNIKLELIHSDFKNIGSICEKLEIKEIDGALLDLGVSSHQLDTPKRGFSYKNDAPLDMRMDASSKLSAFEVVNSYSQKELTDILYAYGEEKWAKRIAEFIVKERNIKSICTTEELVKIIKAAVPAGARKGEKHPAKRTFQALRIEVNKELEGLEQALQSFINLLTPGGRLAVITFHSLEDRIVKKTFKRAESPCICPKELPVCICGLKPSVKIITKKPIVADTAELNRNNRARSAKLRAVEKLRIN